MTDRTIQHALQKDQCSKCGITAEGTRVRGGFLCEECIRTLMIRKQLWVYPLELRNRVIFDEALKRR